VRNYKYLRAAVRVTLVNTHTHRQTTFDWLYYYLSQLSKKLRIRAV